MYAVGAVLRISPAELARMAADLGEGDGRAEERVRQQLRARGLQPYASFGAPEPR
jgi:hypothetical protein